MSSFGISFKHGASAYSRYKCRCPICVADKKRISEDRKNRLKGKEPPIHGTPSSYLVYGCRCEICVVGRTKSRNDYKGKMIGKEPVKHGITGYDIYGCRCKICVSSKNGSHLKRKNNPDVVIQEKERGWRRIGINNFTWKDFCRKHEEQDGKCAICEIGIKKSSEKKSEVATVDHDHSTGKVRALLCGRCNKMIGSEESLMLRKGADYLDFHKGVLL